MSDEPNTKKILIVEDDLPELNALVEKLTHEGFKVLQAHDGLEGLAVAAREHPDLILLDIIMPKMDGLTMIKKLRAQSVWGKHVPIILLTNLSPDEEKINASISDDAPAYYLVKTNWSIGDVAEKVRERLGPAPA